MLLSSYCHPGIPTRLFTSLRRSFAKPRFRERTGHTWCWDRSPCVQEIQSSGCSPEGLSHHTRVGVHRQLHPPCWGCRKKEAGAGPMGWAIWTTNMAQGWHCPSMGTQPACDRRGQLGQEAQRRFWNRTASIQIWIHHRKFSLKLGNIIKEFTVAFKITKIPGSRVMMWKEWGD